MHALRQGQWLVGNARLHAQWAIPGHRLTLNAPERQDALDYECLGKAPQVRLVRQVAPNGQVRVLATNLDAQAFPCEVFCDLYHQRWRIAEAFKRLKHRAKLECVSGLTQHALLVDVAAKVLADNLGSLVCAAAGQAAQLPQRGRVCNRSYAAALMQRLLPRMVVGLDCMVVLLDQVCGLLGANAHRRVKKPLVSSSRPSCQTASAYGLQGVSA